MIDLAWLTEALAPFAESRSNAHMGELWFTSTGGCLHKTNGKMAWNESDPATVRVRVAYPDECRECHGEDPYGQPWCPICEYCCGC